MSQRTAVETADSVFDPFFTDAAESCADRRHLVLDDPGRVLLVDRGAVDLFAVLLEDGVPTGRWTFLCRIGAGTLTTGSPTGPRHGIVARPVLGAVVSLLPTAHLERLSATGQDRVLPPVSSGTNPRGGRLSRNAPASNLDAFRVDQDVTVDHEDGDPYDR